MKILYLIFVLIFSSLIVTNTIPAYANTFSISDGGTGTNGSFLDGNNIYTRHLSGVLDEEATITSIAFDYVSNAGGNIKIGLYGDNLGAPNNLYGFEEFPTSGTGVQTFTFTTPISKPAGSWFVAVSGDTSYSVLKGDLVGSERDTTSGYSVAMKDPFTTTSTAGNGFWVEVVYSTSDTTPPIITLNGANPQSIELGTGYTELGATTDDGSAVTIDNSNFADSLGSYSILYNSIDDAGNNAVTVTRIVNVVDTTPPTITAPNDMTAEATGTQTSVNIGSATATDHSNFTITRNPTTSSFPLGITTITWTATDSSGNSSTVTSTVTIQDTTPPIITLNGANPQSIELGQPYTELGAVCTDNIDGTISPNIDSSNVDTSSIQSYQVRYDCADDSGNNAIQITRTVTVQETVTPDNTTPPITSIQNNLLGLSYNHTRSNYNSTTDKITFTATKQQDIFSLYCKHFTQSTEEWDNQTETTLYNATFLTKQTSYIRCYDESQNIILLQTVYKPYGVASGFEMINESFGNDGLFGVPFPFLIVLAVASIWTGRNAQVGVIVTGATIGIMGLLGLFELPSEVWAMIILLVAVGMFLGKKVF